MLIKIQKSSTESVSTYSVKEGKGFPYSLELIINKGQENTGSLI
jgi:hypothetical protein